MYVVVKIISSLPILGHWKSAGGEWTGCASYTPRGVKIDVNKNRSVVGRRRRIGKISNFGQFLAVPSLIPTRSTRPLQYRCCGGEDTHAGTHSVCVCVYRTVRSYVYMCVWACVCVTDDGGLCRIDAVTKGRRPEPYMAGRPRCGAVGRRPHRRRRCPENSVLCPPSHSHVWPAAAVGIFGSGPFIKPPVPTSRSFISTSTEDQQPHIAADPPQSFNSFTVSQWVQRFIQIPYKTHHICVGLAREKIHYTLIFSTVLRDSKYFL